jgi:hypothetical protein
VTTVEGFEESWANARVKSRALGESKVPETVAAIFQDLSWGGVSVKSEDIGPVRPSPRAELLDEAKALITGDRNHQYGPPGQDFERSAEALSAMGYRGPDGRKMLPHDVAIMVAIVKISRLMWMPNKKDSWLDLAGYAACGYEVSREL